VPDSLPLLLLKRRPDLGGKNKIWYNQDMKHKRVAYTTSIVGLATLILMLCFTSPTEIGPFGVLLFFTTLYLVFFGLSTFFLQAFKRIAFKKENLKNKDYLYSAVLAFGPIMLMMARSFGAINLWTISLILIFLILAEFLIYKRV
jgi:cation transport ATPase